MKVTPDLLQERFAHFNQLIFDSQLPLPIFLPSRARTYLGRYECTVKRTLFGGRELSNHRIRINIVHDFEAEELEDILIHEMIHYYIAYKGLRDTSAHGKIFKTMMAEINQQHNRHIVVSKRRTEKMCDEDNRQQLHYLCVVTLNDGRTAFAPTNRSSVPVLWRRLPEAFGVSDYTWYVTLDPFFNSYRHIRATRRHIPKLRVYPIEREKLMAHLTTAKVVKLVDE